MHYFSNDPLGIAGYWSPQTSAANFCELDYEITLAVAEFVNTLSNLAYVWQAVVTLPRSRRGRGREWQVWAWPVENVALLLVGLTSAAFHLSLRHGAQVLDESSMYALVGAMDYRLWAYGLDGGSTLALGVAMTGVVCGVIGWNFIGNEEGTSSDALHLVLFVALLSALWPKILFMIKKGKAEKATKGEREAASRQMRLFSKGMLYFLSGFGLWLIDGLFCDTLRRIRAAVGLPFAFLFELHGWWHFLTALGAGKSIAVVRDLTEPGQRRNGKP